MAPPTSLPPKKANTGRPITPREVPRAVNDCHLPFRLHQVRHCLSFAPSWVCRIISKCLTCTWQPKPPPLFLSAILHNICWLPMAHLFPLFREKQRSPLGSFSASLFYKQIFHGPLTPGIVLPHHRPILPELVYPLPNVQNAGCQQNPLLYSCPSLVHFYRHNKRLPSSSLFIPGFKNSLPSASTAISSSSKACHSVSTWVP